MFEDLLFHGSSLLFPISKLILALATGLFVASLFEYLQLIKYFSPLTKHIIGFAGMSKASQLSFSLAFASSQAANASLSESYKNGQISRQEVFFINVLNSMPASWSHSISIFFITVPVLGRAGLVYTFLILLSASLRTFSTMILARFFLASKGEVIEDSPSQLVPRVSLREALIRAKSRLIKRLPKIIYFTIPIYVLIYFMQVQGYFKLAESFLVENVAWLNLDPALMGVIALYMGAELSSAITLAGSLLANGVSQSAEIIFALLIGNILSTPMRAIRHQLPSYMGYFPAKLASQLVLSNQISRVLSVVIVALLYNFFIL